MIALLGATGRIGRHVACMLADRGADARALVRRPETAGLPVPTVAADLREPRSLRLGMGGAHALLLLTPHGPDQDLLEAAALEAARGAGVAHIVKVSGCAPSLGPDGPSPTAVAHWRSERRIEASGAGFTFLRPSFLLQNLLTTAAPVVAASGILAAPMGHGPIAMVDARDVAACAVAALLEPGNRDTAWQPTGPRGVTFAEIAATLGVPYLDLPPRLAARAMTRRGAPPWEVEHAVRMAAFLAGGADGVPTDHVRRLTGADPRTAEAFVAEHDSAFFPSTPVARLLSRVSTKGS